MSSELVSQLCLRMSSELVSQLSKTVSVLSSSLKEKDAEIAKLKEELEKQKVQFRKSSKTEVRFSDFTLLLIKTLKKQQTKMERTRQALKKAEAATDIPAGVLRSSISQEWVTEYQERLKKQQSKVEKLQKALEKAEAEELAART